MLNKWFMWAPWVSSWLSSLGYKSLQTTFLAKENKRIQHHSSNDLNFEGRALAYESHKMALLWLEKMYLGYAAAKGQMWWSMWFLGYICHEPLWFSQVPVPDVMMPNSLLLPAAASEKSERDTPAAITAEGPGKYSGMPALTEIHS